jgi:hypothetical protein
MHQASYLPIPDASYVLAEYFLRYYIDTDITYFLPRCYAVLRTHDTRTHRVLSLSVYSHHLYYHGLPYMLPSIHLYSY